MNQLKQLGKNQLHSITRCGTTLFTQSETPHAVLKSIENFIIKRITTNKMRLSATLDDAPNLFAKTYRIRSIPSRLRITFNLKRRIGGYDWAVTEIANNIHCEALNAPTPKIIGFGYVRGRSGLIREIFLINENLTNYSNGIDWLNDASRAEEFASRATSLVQKLNKKHIYHLDPWAGNFMLSAEGDKDTQIIDLENCVIGETAHKDVTLGFQMGYLYQIRLKSIISETHYDAIVKRTLAEQKAPYSKLFEEAYKKYKTQRICKKKRRAIVTQGALLDD